MDRRRRLSKTELALWHHAMREAVPLPGRTALPPAPAMPDPLPASPAPAKLVHVTPATIPAPSPLVLRPGAQAPGLDKRTREKLAGGDMPIEARLDLHGMTQAQARSALDGFIARAWTHGLRAMLIITGKGGANQMADDDWSLWGQKGVLRANVPRWLAEPPNRARILAVAPAQARHGGSGALYVLIRRNRA